MHRGSTLLYTEGQPFYTQRVNPSMHKKVNPSIHRGSTLLHTEGQPFYTQRVNPSTHRGSTLLYIDSTIEISSILGMAVQDKTS